MKKNRYSISDDDEQIRQPLLGADNSLYMSSKPTDPAPRPSLSVNSLPDATNPIYMSNNNGSPTIKKPATQPNYQNIDNANEAA